MSFLSWQELLSVGVVSRQFLNLSRSNDLWRALYCETWKCSSGPTEMRVQWIEIFKEKYLSQLPSRRLSVVKRSQIPSVAKGSPYYRTSVDTSSSTNTDEGRRQSYSLKEEAEPSSDIRGTIVMLGAEGSGKSSLLHYIVTGTPLKGDSEPSRSASFKYRNFLVDGDYQKMKIWDTAGSPQYHMMASLYYTQSDVVLLVYSVTSLDSFRQAQKWYSEIREKCLPHIQFALVGCKADLEPEREVLKEDLESFAIENGSNSLSLVNSD